MNGLLIIKLNQEASNTLCSKKKILWNGAAALIFVFYLFQCALQQQFIKVFPKQYMAFLFMLFTYLFSYAMQSTAEARQRRGEP